MGFDDEVDAAKKRLQKALEEEGPSEDDLAALQNLIPLLEEKIASRRITFAVPEAEDDDDDQISIAIVHTATDEELGFVYCEGGEFVFESNLDGYFDDFVDDDAERFVARLYETLRADLAKYEVENKS
ncbi:MAG: hypothetical protein ABW199_11505 [Caulobacterales bacterium]